MARPLVCDVCRKVTTEIVFKMFLAPANSKGRTSSAPTSNYTHHMDVGVCCKDQVKSWPWTPRKSSRRAA